MHLRKYIPCIVSLFLIHINSPASLAQSDQTNDAADLINSEVADLGNSDPNVAADAQKQLIGLGDLAIPAVQKLLRQPPNPNARKRAQEILTALESHYKIDPTLVTLHLDSTPTQEVFDELSKIGGVRIEGQWDFWNQHPQGMPRRTSVNFDKVPFAQALYQICQQTSINLQDSNWLCGYTIQPRWNNSHPNYPTFFSSPILYILDSVDRDSSIDLADKSESDNLTLSIHAISDPRLPIRRVFNNAIVTEAIGDTGQSLVEGNDQNSNNEQWSSGVTFFADASLTLKFKTDQNKTIKSLKGAVRFEIPLSPLKVEFPEFKAGQSATAGTWNVKIKSIRATNNGYTANIIADNSDTNPEDQSRQSNNICQCQLYDAKSLPYIAQFNGGYFGPKHFDFNIHFLPGPDNTPPHAGPPAKLVVQLCTANRTIRVPFEFTDIPIPSPAY